MVEKVTGEITARELLAADPRHKAILERELARQEQAASQYEIEAAPVIHDLRNLGYDVKTVRELRTQRRRYKKAIPVLVHWLPKVTYGWLKEDIIRTLSVPWARPEAVEPLVDEFLRTPDSEDEGLRWVIGNALEVVADDSVFDRIAAIAMDDRYGRSREMVVASLGNMRDDRAASMLLSLLDDDAVAPYAVKGLGKLKYAPARVAIERFLRHPEVWVRKEARRALRALPAE